MLGPNTASRQPKKPADHPALRIFISCFYSLTPVEVTRLCLFPFSTSYSKTSIHMVNKHVGISMHMQTHSVDFCDCFDMYYVNLKEFSSTNFIRKNHITRIFATERTSLQARSQRTVIKWNAQLTFCEGNKIN